MEARVLARIESWALNVIDRVRLGQKVEDSRVELKREWPIADKGARRIAAHANAALGSEILWIIGLDEVSGIVGVNPEISDWWRTIQSQFDGIAPSLIDLSIDADGMTLWALSFDTSRAPY